VSSGIEPYAGFQGKVERILAKSEPWWPSRVTAPAGAPNIVLVLVDDMGYSDLGCYGSEIDTPNVNRLAAEGIRYTNFHVTPLCSPTRAALMTGLNPHNAGLGMVANCAPGFPGYAGELAENTATMAEILRANGYATFIVGKWHLVRDEDFSEAGPKHAWPLQRGFDRFYGYLTGPAFFHQPPYLIEDNHAVDLDAYPEGYYFTDDITDRAISMVRSVKAANPAKPFFLYFAHGAVHAPLHVKSGDLEIYKDAYHAGWDVVRERRFRRQQELGVMPEGTVLPPRNSEPHHEVKAWEALSDREKELFARYMAIYAGMVDNIDQNFGRLRAAIEQLGEWDNTIVVFMSDNGASREGEQDGTAMWGRSSFAFLSEGADPASAFELDYAYLDLMGGPRTFPHYPRGWAMVSNTPFRLYKRNTHNGGQQVPLILSWPARLRSAAGSFRRQYAYVTDILPTLLDLAGLQAPAERNGIPVKPIQGTSFAPTIADPAAPAPHREQYYEMFGHRGFYRDGWEVQTLHQTRTKFSEDHWELYDLRADPTEAHDLSAAHPKRVAELIDAWEKAAWQNQVFPLDEGVGLMWLQRRPHDPALTQPLTIYPGTPTLEKNRSTLLIRQRSFTVTIRLDYRPGEQGILVSHGSQAGGYAVYIENGELHYFFQTYGWQRALAGGQVPAGAREIVLDVNAPGGNKWDVRLFIDGREVARADGFPMLGLFVSVVGGIDVGIDRRSPVCWDLYERHGTFAYSGALESVTYTPGVFAPDAGAQHLAELRQVGLKFE
jgi:arylsulfatase